MATLQKKSPLARMREDHKDKETLVDRLMDVIERAGEEKEELKAKLLAISNRKLLRLLDTATEVKSKFGSREKLAAALATVAGKAKDQDYVNALAKHTPNRLLELYRAAEKRAKRVAAAAE